MIAVLASFPPGGHSACQRWPLGKRRKWDDTFIHLHSMADTHHIPCRARFARKHTQQGWRVLFTRSEDCGGVRRCASFGDACVAMQRDGMSTQCGQHGIHSLRLLPCNHYHEWRRAICSFSSLCEVSPRSPSPCQKLHQFANCVNSNGKYETLFSRTVQYTMPPFFAERMYN